MCRYVSSTMDTHVVRGKEMRTKAQVGIPEASAYFAVLALLSISVSWTVILDNRSLFMLV